MVITLPLIYYLTQLTTSLSWYPSLTIIAVGQLEGEAQNKIARQRGKRGTMSSSADAEGSEDVNDFLLRIRELGEKRDKEDEERTRKLEEEILQGRKERQARRAGISGFPCYSPPKPYVSHDSQKTGPFQDIQSQKLILSSLRNQCRAGTVDIADERLSIYTR
ncbi:gelsolin repeat protein [Aspergillus bombycis]|uniref:Gelsolin repeat protein n=1 Tax=Aspergillus bombycis TaxID=109264 RepID=A0A1F7ZW60_9EURO|nr:gelsolin repeat protein [Aspergillus bombycis]OGM43686.1 gelsolin repeat protein [Aspergillus bombycis]